MASGTTSETDLAAVFATCVEQALLERIPEDQSLAIPMDDGLVVFRGPTAAPFKMSGATRDRPWLLVRRVKSPWRAVAGLSDLVHRRLAAVPTPTPAPMKSSHVILPFAVLSATRITHRLLEQLGAPEQAEIDTRRLAGDLDEILLTLTRTVSAARSLTMDTTKAMGEAVRQRAQSVAAKKTCVLRVRKSRDGTARVEYRSHSGSKLHAEPLGAFARAVTEPAAAQAIRDADRIRDAIDRRRDDGLERLRDVSPLLADGVQRALAKGRVAMYLCGGRLEDRYPVDVWLYLDPEGSLYREGGCTLSVHGGHPEFALQNAQKGLFYFPPCLLTARIFFGFGSEGQLMRPSLPRIRQPKACGYPFIHPYSGELGREFFSGATTGETSEPAMPEASDRAKALFSTLLSARPRIALERDLCLDAQDVAVNALFGDFQTELASTPKPDVARYVRNVHDFLRRGLTNGHQLNTGPPRVGLNAESMHYVLPANAANGPWANRIFPFNPRIPAAVS